jgi:hypothetical protein
MRRSIRAVTLYLSVFASLSLTVFDASAATSLAEFPIGYSSNGGTYGFIGLVEQQRLLDQQGIRPQVV